MGRYIDVDVQRAVRQECCFGCVICGNLVTQFEHFDPPFAEARTHRIEGIALLCGSCHDQKTRKFLSVESVRAARANPKACRDGFASTQLDAMAPFQLEVGAMSFENVTSILRLGGEELLVVQPPNRDGGPVRVSGTFYDEAGAEVLKLVENVIEVRAENWDAQAMGGRFIVRKGKRNIALELSVIPPHLLRIEYLKMRTHGLSIEVRRNGVVHLYRDGVSITLDRASIHGSSSVFDF